MRRQEISYTAENTYATFVPFVFEKNKDVLNMRIYFEYYLRYLIRFIKVQSYTIKTAINVNRLHVRYEMWGWVSNYREPLAGYW